MIHDRLLFKLFNERMDSQSKNRASISLREKPSRVYGRYAGSRLCKHSDKRLYKYTKTKLGIFETLTLLPKKTGLTSIKPCVHSPKLNYYLCKSNLCIMKRIF